MLSGTTILHLLQLVGVTSSSFCMTSESQRSPYLSTRNQSLWLSLVTSQTTKSTFYLQPTRASWISLQSRHRNLSSNMITLVTQKQQTPKLYTVVAASEIIKKLATHSWLVEKILWHQLFTLMRTPSTRLGYLRDRVFLMATPTLLDMLNQILTHRWCFQLVLIIVSEFGIWIHRDVLLFSVDTPA
jgi:hypothetical protein